MTTQRFKCYGFLWGSYYTIMALHQPFYSCKNWRCVVSPFGYMGVILNTIRNQEHLYCWAWSNMNSGKTQPNWIISLNFNYQHAKWMSASVGINVQPTSSIMQEVEDVDFQQSKKYLSFLVATTNTAGTGIHPLIIGNVRVKRDRKRCFFKYCVYCLMVTSSGSSICTFTAGQIQRIYRQEICTGDFGISLAFGWIFPLKPRGLIRDGGEHSVLTGSDPIKNSICL